MKPQDLFTEIYARFSHEFSDSYSQMLLFFLLLLKYFYILSLFKISQFIHVIIHFLFCKPSYTDNGGTLCLQCNVVTQSQWKEN